MGVHSRRSLLVTAGGAVLGGTAGCLTSGGDDGGDGGADGWVDGGSGDGEQGLAAGGTTLPGRLQDAFEYVYRPANSDPGSELAIHLVQPAKREGGAKTAIAGAVDPTAVDWGLTIELPSSLQPRSVLVGGFEDADPATAAGVDPAGELRSLSLYSYHDWLLALDDDRLLLGDRDWIERVLDRQESDATGVLDRNQWLTALLGAIEVREIYRGRAVLHPTNLSEHVADDPDGVAWARQPLDGDQYRRVMAHRFGDGYDDDTVAGLEAAIRSRFGVDDVEVDRRDALVVLEATDSVESN